LVLPIDFELGVICYSLLPFGLDYIKRNLEMKKPFSPPIKLEGMPLDKFMEHISDGDIHAQQARLIPTYKTGDELALASIFLSGVKLVKEFREKVCSEIKFKKAGKQYFFTEVVFSHKEFGDCRFDGLMLSVVGGKIKDFVFFEFKGKNGKLESDQVDRYVKFIRKNYRGNKLVTVSTEYVADPTQRPYKIGALPKGFEVYHLSWSYIKTMAHLLLFDNDENIEDEDQVEILREVLNYFESDSIGLKGYSQMKSGWRSVVESIKTGVKPNPDDVEEAVQSWLEEQTDMAHILSQELGAMVKTCSAKKDQRLKARLKSESQELLKNDKLTFNLQVKGVASEVVVWANFRKETVGMSFSVLPPTDRGNSARVTYIEKELQRCEKNNHDTMAKIDGDLFVDVHVKYASSDERFPKSETYRIKDEISNSPDINEFKIVYIKSLGAKFKSSKGFVDIIEQMMVDFYQGVVQNARPWTPPAPRIQKAE